MYRGRSNLLPVIVLVVVAVVAIIAFVSIGRALLGGGQRETVDDSASRALLTTETDRSVRMTVRGAIVADEDFRSYDIEISPINRKLTTYKGYKGEVIDTVRLTNNTEAYAEFVHALSRANFTNDVELPETLDEIRGACAAGRLYEFSLLQAQVVTYDSWTTSCRDITGSFRGDAVLARDLIQRQIPGSRDLLRDIDL